MRYAGFTRQERNFITLMRLLIVVFLGAAALFAAIPDILLNYINDIGKVFLGWQSPPIAAGGDLWRVMAVAHNICLAYACAVAQGSALRNANYARIVLIALAAQAAGFAAMIFLDGPQFYYLAAAAADLAAFLLTLRIYTSSARSRS
ncbi:MAG: hypothetical protein JXA24_00720 [Proteobacteria bacterium]|nr:hypothetical protein [Pseudomonadota bacterium]